MGSRPIGGPARPLGDEPDADQRLHPPLCLRGAPARRRHPHGQRRRCLEIRRLTHTPIQRCQIHKGRNILERLPKHLHASVRRTLRQAWELDDVGKAEQLLRNLARRLEQEAPGVSETILEGIGEILTVVRLKLPPQLRRSLA